MKHINISIIVFVAGFMMYMLLGCSGNEPELVALSQDINNTEDSRETLAEEESRGVETDKDEKLICIHISGSVVNPGLYELSEGSRLYDAVMEAGGFTNDAAVDYSNLAETLLDGVKYHIYSETEVSDMQMVSTSPEKDSHYNSAGQLNINLATVDELMELSGIGKSKAEAIVEYRDANGTFESIEEIKEVSGIGEGLYSKIEDSITVN